jgi:hypothetical protein
VDHEGVERCEEQDKKDCQKDEKICIMNVDIDECCTKNCLLGASWTCLR